MRPALLEMIIRDSCVEGVINFMASWPRLSLHTASVSPLCLGRMSTLSQLLTISLVQS